VGSGAPAGSVISTIAPSANQSIRRCATTYSDPSDAKVASAFDARVTNTGERGPRPGTTSNR